MEMIKRHKKFFNLAVNIADTSRHHYYKLGAIICKRHDILSVGVNQSCQHPALKSLGYKPWHNVHAEAAAVMLATRRRIDIRGATMYVGRIRRRGDVGASKPCSACTSLLIEAGIKQVVYYDNEIKICKL
jgi:deoxycytidylate deaminase